jgi:hypothetical protein
MTTDAARPLAHFKDRTLPPEKMYTFFIILRINSYYFPTSINCLNFAVEIQFDSSDNNLVYKILLKRIS